METSPGQARLRAPPWVRWTSVDLPCEGNGTHDNSFFDWYFKSIAVPDPFRANPIRWHSTPGRRSPGELAPGWFPSALQAGKNVGHDNADEHGRTRNEDRKGRLSIQ